jgi:hypothetical protein
MNFSFFDISVKSPNDLYSWSRIKSTLLMNWYVLWRLMLLVLVVLILFFGIVIIQDYPIEAINLYMEHSWFEFASILLSTFITSMFTYNSLYRKNYSSFHLHFEGVKKPQFWSAYFWKRYILFTCATVLPYRLIETNLSVEIILNGVSLLISHISLHSGFWGVTHQSKQ